MKKLTILLVVNELICNFVIDYEDLIYGENGNSKCKIAQQDKKYAR